MKKLILILTILISFISNSQSRIGFSYNEIRDEFSEHYTYTTGYRDNLGKFLEFEIPGAVTTYYFNEDNVCNLVTLLPNSKGDLHYFIEEYNKKYVVVSKVEWRVYTDGYIINITLEYVKDGVYVFMFTL